LLKIYCSPLYIYFSILSPLRSTYFCQSWSIFISQSWQTHASWWKNHNFTALLTSSSNVQRWPLTRFFSFRKRRKSDDAKLGLYDGWAKKVKPKHHISAFVLVLMRCRALSCCRTGCYMWRKTLQSNTSSFPSVSHYLAELMVVSLAINSECTTPLTLQITACMTLPADAVVFHFFGACVPLWWNSIHSLFRLEMMHPTFISLQQCRFRIPHFQIHSIAETVG
jgi:hypothetical protein